MMCRPPAEPARASTDGRVEQAMAQAIDQGIDHAQSIEQAVEQLLSRRYARALRWNPSRGWERLSSTADGHLAWIADRPNAEIAIARVLDELNVPKALRPAMLLVAVRALRDKSLAGDTRRARAIRRMLTSAPWLHGPGDAA